MKQHLFFPWALCRQALLLAGGLLLFAACKKEEALITPTWYTKGNSYYYYDLDSAGKTIRNFSVIEVRQINPGEMEFMERIQYPTRFVYSSLTNLNDKDLFTQKEGLFAEYRNECGFGFLGGTTRYLLAPSNPKTGQQIPIYGCSKTLMAQIPLLQQRNQSQLLPALLKPFPLRIMMATALGGIRVLVWFSTKLL